MIVQDTTKTEDLGLFTRLTSTVNRCHMLGAIVATALMLGIGWVWSFNQSEVLQIECGGTVVNLDDARGLIENANQWRQQYTVGYTESQDIDKLVKSISMWLPKSVDWSTAERDIRSIGTTTEMTILAIEQGDHHVGKRVGIVTATCSVQGSFHSLCEFLNELSKRPHPIACSEITLHRLTADEKRDAGTAKTGCIATLSLRIPFAASGTAAGQLLSTENKNAS